MLKFLNRLSPVRKNNREEQIIPATEPNSNWALDPKEERTKPVKTKENRSENEIKQKNTQATKIEETKLNP